MKNKNKALMEQMITAIYAKDKLDAIVDLINNTKGKSVSKAELQAILDEDNNDLFNED